MTGRPSDPAAKAPAGLTRVRDLSPGEPSPAPGQPSGTAHAVVGCQTRRDQRDTRRELRLRVSVFFDGTCNNRTNVDLGPSFNRDASYRGAKTNIALLEAAGLACPGPDVDEHVTVYVEGVGTTDRLGDSLRDMVTGKGSTGIRAKVEAAVEKVTAQVRSITQRRILARLEVDAFGFSRGAAAARHFISAVTGAGEDHLRSRLRRLGHPASEIVVKLVGLFDTVASHGLTHDDDTTELNLDAIKAAERVVHLIAADEHRRAYRLTNIASAGRRGVEISLPGSHSDVGGGYSVNDHERGHIVFDLLTNKTTPLDRERLARERQWLVDAGWYQTTDLSIDEEHGRIVANRQPIGHVYARIPLHLMARFARAHGVPVGSQVEEDHPIAQDLLTVQSILNQADSWPNANSSLNVEPRVNAAAQAWLFALRNRHLHFSAAYGVYGGANEPQWTTGGPARGRRQRIVQPG